MALLLLAAPLAVAAQTAAKTARVGVVQPYSPPPAWPEALRQGLRDAGYVEGQNLVIEWRNAEGRRERHPALFGELVAQKVDVLLTWSTPAALAAKQATGTIPIVAISGDPVGTGLARSLARPGGNVTGLVVLTDELDPKQLQLLRDAVPGLSHVGVLTNPVNPALRISVDRIRDAAQAMGLKVQVFEVQKPGEIEAALAAARTRVGALLVLRDDVLTSSRIQIVTLAAKHRLPAIYGWREFAEDGGLIVYGVSMPDLFRRLAAYVDKILKGTPPASLPLEQPTKFELVINLRTAKALALTIPPALRLQADEVIE